MSAPTFLRGRIELHHGDSEELLPNLPQVDCILTDPPYGIGYAGPGHCTIANDDKPPLHFVPLMADRLKPDGRMMIWTSHKVQEAWMNSISDAGLTVRETILWDKMNPYFTQGNRSQEILVVADKGRPLVFNDDTELSWQCPVPREKQQRADHPTPKPVDLMKRALRKYTSRDDVVADPFMGCGPVGVAAVSLDRRYIGVELKKGYFDTAVARIERHQDVRAKFTA